jgi:hypothetical protein
VLLAVGTFSTDRAKEGAGGVTATPLFFFIGFSSMVLLLGACGAGVLCM